MSGREWRIPERVLLVAVIFLAVLAVFRLATREPAREPVAPSSPGQEGAQPPAPAAVPRPDLAAGPPPSPACAELLARIRSCSEQDLDAIVDKLAGVEAYSLYHQLTVSDRQTVLSAMPVPILARKAQELLGVPESCFRNAGKAGLLASSLVDAAMGAARGQTDGQRKELCFTTVVDEQDGPQGPRASFRPDERKIYACLDTGSASTPEPGVLVRWSEEDSGALVYLRYLPLAVSRRWNYVYFEVTGAWAPGAYRVEFYRVGESAGLLAAGTYVVGKGD